MKSKIALILVCFSVHLTAGELDPGPLQQQWFKHYEKQKNLPDPGKMLLNTKPEPALTDGFIDLFNGRDLSDWEVIGGTCKFDVQGDAIRGVCDPESESTYLYTKKTDFADFIFTCDLKWEVEGNTGVMFRASRTEGKNEPSAYGPQMEMEPFSQEREWSGGIYGQACGGWFYPVWLTEHAQTRQAQKQHGWNRMTIEARGSEIRTWLNGVPVANWRTDTFLSGAFGLQIHKGDQGTVLWRNLKVKPLH
jgi:hypothetical protein